ncbi:MAG: hypothetical protein GX456_18675 [Verrucomicrobia bacterium]|nr:hypothetical protein [Verrucomicrobiota bacterium]
MLVSRPPKGGTRTAVDAVGVGRREALGVRQLAAALFSCTNKVPGIISAALGRRLRNGPASPVFLSTVLPIASLNPLPRDQS